MRRWARRSRIGIVVVAGWLAAAAPAAALPVTVPFAGSVLAVNDTTPGGLLSGVAVGQAIQVALTIDSDAVDLFPGNPIIGGYDASGSPFGFEVTVGGLVLRSSEVRADVTNDSTLGGILPVPIDNYTVRADLDEPVLGLTHQVSMSPFVLAGDLIDSDAQLTTAAGFLGLGALDFRWFEAGQINAPYLQAELLAVPEPSPLLLLAPWIAAAARSRAARSPRRATQG